MLVDIFNISSWNAEFQDTQGCTYAEKPFLGSPSPPHTYTLHQKQTNKKACVVTFQSS